MLIAVYFFQWRGTILPGGGFVASAFAVRADRAVTWLAGTIGWIQLPLTAAQMDCLGFDTGRAAGMAPADRRSRP